jgi:hypothetical protein
MSSSPISHVLPARSRTRLDTEFIGADVVRHHRRANTDVIVVEQNQPFPILLRSTSPHGIDTGRIVALQRYMTSDTGDDDDNDKYVNNDDELPTYTCGTPDEMQLPIGDFVKVSATEREQMFDVRVYAMREADANAATLLQNGGECLHFCENMPIKIGCIQMLRPERTHLLLRQVRITQASSADTYLYFIRIGFRGGHTVDSIVRPVLVGPFYAPSPAVVVTKSEMTLTPSIMAAFDRKHATTIHDRLSDDWVDIVTSAADSTSDSDDDDDDLNDGADVATPPPIRRRVPEPSWMLDDARTTPLLYVDGSISTRAISYRSSSPEETSAKRRRPNLDRCRRRLWAADDDTAGEDKMTTISDNN